MEINIKMCIVGIFITLTGCTKQNSDAIFVQESNKNYSKYNFIIDDRLFFSMKKDSTDYKLEKDTLYLNYSNEIVKYHRLNMEKTDRINYEGIHISLKNMIDSPFFFNYDMNIAPNGTVTTKIYSYEGNKILHSKLSKPFDDWVDYTLSDVDKYRKFYGIESKDDKAEIAIVLKNTKGSKLIYGDLNYMPSKIQLLAFILEVYLKQNYKNQNFIGEINNFPSQDSLSFYSKKTGIGTGRIAIPHSE